MAHCRPHIPKTYTFFCIIASWCLLSLICQAQFAALTFGSVTQYSKYVALMILEAPGAMTGRYRSFSTSFTSGLSTQNTEGIAFARSFIPKDHYIASDERIAWKSNSYTWNNVPFDPWTGSNVESRSTIIIAPIAEITPDATEFHANITVRSSDDTLMNNTALDIPLRANAIKPGWAREFSVTTSSLNKTGEYITFSINNFQQETPFESITFQVQGVFDACYFSNLATGPSPLTCSTSLDNVSVTPVINENHISFAFPGGSTVTAGANLQIDCSNQLAVIFPQGKSSFLTLASISTPSLTATLLDVTRIASNNHHHNGDSDSNDVMITLIVAIIVVILVFIASRVISRVMIRKIKQEEADAAAAAAAASNGNTVFEGGSIQYSNGQDDAFDYQQLTV